MMLKTSAQMRMDRLIEGAVSVVRTLSVFKYGLSGDEWVADGDRLRICHIRLAQFMHIDKSKDLMLCVMFNPPVGIPATAHVSTLLLEDSVEYLPPHMFLATCYGFMERRLIRLPSTIASRLLELRPQLHNTKAQRIWWWGEQDYFDGEELYEDS